MSIEKSQHEEFANNDNINDLDNIEMNIKSFHFVFDFQQKKLASTHALLHIQAKKELKFWIFL